MHWASVPKVPAEPRVRTRRVRAARVLGNLKKGMHALTTEESD